MISTTSDSLVSTVSDYLFTTVQASMSMEFMLFLFAMGAYSVLLLSKRRRPKQWPKCCHVEDPPVLVSDATSQTRVDTPAQVFDRQQLDVAQTTIEALVDVAEPTVEAVNEPFCELVAEPQNQIIAHASDVEETTKPDDTLLLNLRLEECLRGKLFEEGLELYSVMAVTGVQMNIKTRLLMIKLLSHTRVLREASKLLRGLESTLCVPALSSSKPQLMLPPLAATVARNADTVQMCTNHIKITGDLPDLRAACRSLKKNGFMKRCKDDKFQLNGHWVTEHGLNVIIEGKIVRWSPKRASRLKFLDNSRDSCSLGVYGENTVGRLLPPTIAEATKTLKWDNGDVWQQFEESRIAHAAVVSQSMTKVSRDDTRDEVVRAQVDAKLKCVSRDGMNLLPNCLDQVLQFLGSDTYVVEVNFDCKDGPAWMDAEAGTDFVNSLSICHPRVGFRHCWADQSKDVCGQRTILQGKEVDEETFTCCI